MAQDLSPAKAYEYTSVNQLMWRRFHKHRLARIGGAVLIVLYVLALLSDYLAPYDANTRLKGFRDVPPSRIRVTHESGTPRPFIYGIEGGRFPRHSAEIYTRGHGKSRPIAFFVPGDPYKFMGLVDSDRHLFGVSGKRYIFLFEPKHQPRPFVAHIKGARISSSSPGLPGMLNLLPGGCRLRPVGLISAPCVEIVQLFHT